MTRDEEDVMDVRTKSLKNFKILIYTDAGKGVIAYIKQDFNASLTEGGGLASVEKILVKNAYLMETDLLFYMPVFHFNTVGVRAVKHPFGVRTSEDRLHAVDPLQKFSSSAQVEFAHNVVQNEYGILARKLFKDLYFGEL